MRSTVEHGLGGEGILDETDCRSLTVTVVVGESYRRHMKEGHDIE